MTDSVLAVGEKLHIMTRRLFADDVHLHFVGEISAVAGPLFKAKGYSFVFDSRTRMSSIPMLALGCSHSPMLEAAAAPVDSSTKRCAASSHSSVPESPRAAVAIRRAAGGSRCRAPANRE